MGAKCSLGRRCDAEVRGKREDLLVEDASGVFSAYQAFMGNIQTVSTLLLGFLITGTLLSVVLTGSENFGADKIYLFTTEAVMSVVFSGAAMLLGFVIQARGTSAYENFGAVKAVKSMRRSTVCICVAESCIYLSLIFFLASLQDWILMHYIGPDICPYSQEDKPSSEAFCSQLGVDFYWAMQLTCEHTPDGALEQVAAGDAAAGHGQRVVPRRLGGPDSARRLEDRHVFVKEANSTRHGRNRVDHSFVCQQYEFLRLTPRKLIPPLQPRNYAVWDCTIFEGTASGQIVERSACESPEHLQLMNDVSEVLCEVNKMTTLRRQLCFPAGGHKDPVEAQGCAEAYTAYRKSMECVDANLEDAKKCYQVCQWTNDEPPRKRLHRHIGFIFQTSTAVLLVVSLLRGGRGLHQACIVFATDDAALSKQLLHQTMLKDPESSDEDELEEACHLHGRGNFQSEPQDVKETRLHAQSTRKLQHGSSPWSTGKQLQTSPMSRPPTLSPPSRSPPAREAMLPRGWGGARGGTWSGAQQAPSRELQGGSSRARDPEWAGADGDDVPDCSVF